MALKWKLLSSLAVIFGLACLIVAIVLYTSTGGDIPFEHGIVIDAGSTHSEALLYRWEGEKYLGTGKVKQIANCGIKNGIAKYLDPRKAGEDLLPCLKEVSEKVDAKKRSDIAVYLAATGGMRLLNITNPHQAISIIIGLECTIPKSNMTVKNVSIINGQDEGVFGWITTNYLEGVFQDKNHSTVGAADMGGASTQISFEVDASVGKSQGIEPFKLYGENYYVYSKSYLCYGSTEIYRRYLSRLLDIGDLPNTGPIDDPCGNPGSRVVQTASWLLDQPCSKTPGIVTTWVFLNPGKMNTNYTFIGTGKPGECKTKVEKLFDPEECRKSSYSECFTPIHSSLVLPNYFDAFSSYYWTVNFMNATKGTPMKNFTDNVEGYCKKPWKEIEAEISKYDPGALADLPRYCFLGTMIHQILTKGYGFNETTWSNIRFTRKVNDVSLGWTLGYMTRATNAIPEEDPTLPVLPLAGLIVLVVVGGLLVIGGIIALWFSFR